MNQAKSLRRCASLGTQTALALMGAALSAGALNAGCGALDSIGGSGFALPASSITFAQAPRAPGSADPFTNPLDPNSNQNPIFFPGFGTIFTSPPTPSTDQPGSEPTSPTNTGNTGGTGG